MMANSDLVGRVSAEDAGYFLFLAFAGRKNKG